VTANPYTKGRRAHGAWAKGYELGKSNALEKFDSRQADVRAAFGEGWKAGQAERSAR
jgi:hypothetical protein